VGVSARGRKITRVSKEVSFVITQGLVEKAVDNKVHDVHVLGSVNPKRSRK